jgi:hypothetical protein
LFGGPVAILDPRGAEADDEPPAVNTRKERSDGELNELGNTLVRGLSIEEIARLLRRDHGEAETKSSGWRSADLGASATLPLRSRLYPNSISAAFCA